MHLVEHAFVGPVTAQSECLAIPSEGCGPPGQYHVGARSPAESQSPDLQNQNLRVNTPG